MNMTTVESVLLALLVLDAIALVVLVLLQQGKGADAGASFGSGSSNTMFGSLGAASFLTKATAWLAIGFFVIAFGLAYTANERAATAGSIGIPTLDGIESGYVPAAGSNSDVPAADIPVLDNEADAVDAALDAALEQVQDAGDALDSSIDDVPVIEGSEPVVDDVPLVEGQN